MVTRSPRAWAPIMVALVIGLAACSPTPGTGPIAIAPGAAVGVGLDPAAPTCTLLTNEEAQEAFNQTFVTPVGGAGEPGFCQYFNSNGFGLQVEVSRAATALEDYTRDLEEAGAAATVLDDVGEQAFEKLQGRRFIEFTKGGALVTLYSASRIDAELFRELARLVASRIE